MLPPAEARCFTSDAFALKVRAHTQRPAANA